MLSCAEMGRGRHLIAHSHIKKLLGGGTIFPKRVVARTWRGRGGEGSSRICFFPTFSFAATDLGVLRQYNFTVPFTLAFYHQQGCWPRGEGPFLFVLRGLPLFSCVSYSSCQLFRRSLSLNRCPCSCRVRWGGWGHPASSGVGARGIGFLLFSVRPEFRSVVHFSRLRSGFVQKLLCK